MGKRGRILIVLAVVALLGVFVWSLLPTSAPEPVYNGKPFSYWLDQLQNAPTNQNTYGEAMFAVHTIGTNAIPTLLQMLRVHDFSLKIKVLMWTSESRFLGVRYTPPWVINNRAMRWFYELGPQAASAVPELTRILDENISLASEDCTAMSLGFVGPDAKAAVPALLRAAATKDPPVLRHCAMIALQQIDPETYARVVTNATPVAR